MKLLKNHNKTKKFRVLDNNGFFKLFIKTTFSFLIFVNISRIITVDSWPSKVSIASNTYYDFTAKDYNCKYLQYFPIMLPDDC